MHPQFTVGVHFHLQYLELNTFLIGPSEGMGVYYSEKYEELITSFLPLFFYLWPSMVYGI